jgi:transposase
MAQQTLHKTYKYKLKPTSDQERTLAFVLRRCCELYNAALLERREAWRKCGVGVTLAQQSAQLPEIKEVRPEYRDINAQVLQDVLMRLDRAFQAFFRRIHEGQTPGYPRFHSANRYDSFTYKQVGEHGGARLDSGSSFFPRLGASRCAGRARLRAHLRR